MVTQDTTQETGGRIEPQISWGQGIGISSAIIGAGPEVKEFLGRLLTVDPASGLARPPFGTFMRPGFNGGDPTQRLVVQFDWVHPMVDNGCALRRYQGVPH